MRGEHTPWEWALQKLADAIEPLGENRADMRAAAAVAQIARALGADSQTIGEAAEYARNYLPINTPQQRTLTPEEAAEIKRSK